MSFDACRDGYIADHEKKWGALHRQDWINSMKSYATPVLGARSIDVINTSMVLSVLRPIWQSKHVTAARVQQRIEAVLDWAKAQGYREGANPAQWKGHLSYALAGTADIYVVKKHPAMHYREIAGLVTELQTRDDRDALCLQLLIYTATRVNAAAGARMEEFDLENRVWMIPAVRMKRRGKRKALGFHVPLSDAAVKIVRHIGVQTGLLFPRSSKHTLMRAHGREDITTHGFRSCFKTWGLERTSFKREIIEIAMSHRIGDVTEESYIDGDALEARRELMDAWAEFCLTPWERSAAKADNVIALRPRA